MCFLTRIAEITMVIGMNPVVITVIEIVTETVIEVTIQLPTLTQYTARLFANRTIKLTLSGLC